jgi:hypothetical protein
LNPRDKATTLPGPPRASGRSRLCTGVALTSLSPVRSS